MRKVLIIRSVSLQQLDLIIGKIADNLKADTIHLLTPPHNHSHCEKYKDISKIIDYPEKTSFSCLTLPDELKKEEYDAVVVPVSNIKGSGFLNVMLLAMRVKAKEIYTCNLATDIKKLSRTGIVARKLLDLLAIPFSAVLTLISIIPVSLILLLRLKKRK